MRRLIFVMVCFAALFVPFRAMADSADERKGVALRVFDEVFNHGKYEVADEVYAKDFLNHGMTRDYTLADDQAALRAWRDAAPDLKMTVQKALVDGEYVTVLWSGEGTNTGTFQGFPATGKKFRARGITIWRIADGKIREEWSQFDETRLLLQIGLLAPVEKKK